MELVALVIFFITSLKCKLEAPNVVTGMVNNRDANAQLMILLLADEKKEERRQKTEGFKGTLEKISPMPGSRTQEKTARQARKMGGGEL